MYEKRQEKSLRSSDDYRSRKLDSWDNLWAVEIIDRLTRD